MEETDFWKALKALCKERGTTPSAVARELGFSSGSPTVWKRGATPSMFTVGKLAEFFGVDMGVFYGATPETKKAPSDISEGDLDGIVRFALFGDAEISDDDYESVKLFAKMLAEKARKKNSE